ncbi:MAG: hypothetical protein AMJ68_09820, partial [Acidithiobacillales bacterium SG8_45]
MSRKKDEEKLLQWFRRLPDAQARSLLDYAHFLNEQHGAHPESLTLQDIPRPEDETVISAIKRLRSTYPMLDPAHLLAETSELMNKHLLQGQEAEKV